MTVEDIREAFDGDGQVFKKKNEKKLCCWQDPSRRLASHDFWRRLLKDESCRKDRFFSFL